MPEIRAVIFDYGLVLSGPPDPLAWSRMQSVLDAVDPVFHDAYWRHRHNYDLGSLDARAYWSKVASDLGRSPSSAQVDELIAADVDLWTRPNWPMIDWARSLQSSGTPTAILSNIGDAMETGILERLPWMRGFTQLTFSHRLGLAKPDERIYRHAIEALAISPGAALFIDDRKENVDAARRIGIHAVQYTGHEQFLREFESSRFTGIVVPPQPAPTESVSAE